MTGRAWLLAAVATVACSTSTHEVHEPVAPAAPATAAAPRPHSVRFVYLVSADREAREDYRGAIEAAARSVQAYYASQLDGLTIALNDPVVEIVRSAQPAAWFPSHPSGGHPDDWGYNNALEEVRRLLGAGHDQAYVWVIYSDGPGDKGRGGNGVAGMPEDDLLGLIGRHPTQPSIARWIGGLGHELGHALGLPHPPDLEREAGALMASGFYDGYPERCYLTAADKVVLGASAFIDEPGAVGASTAIMYTHEQGRFVRRERRGQVRWSELASDGASYQFVERASPDAGYYLLEDPGRALWLRIPRAGGRSLVSSNGGATWDPLYELTAPAR